MRLNGDAWARDRRRCSESVSGGGRGSRSGRESQPVVLHSDHSTQFACEEYQQFLTGHNRVSSMGAVGHSGDNPAAEGFFRLLKRERVNRRHYRAIVEVHTDVFDYIERFHDPRMQQRLGARDRKFLALTQMPTKMR